MLFVRSHVRHTGFEFTQADDASLLAPQVTRFQNTQSLAYNPRRSPAQFSYQNCEPLPRSVIQPGLNCDSHSLIVLQVAICMTRREFTCSCGSLADPDFELGARRTSGPVGETGAQKTSFELAPTVVATMREHAKAVRRTLALAMVHQTTEQKYGG